MSKKAYLHIIKQLEEEIEVSLVEIKDPLRVPQTRGYLIEDNKIIKLNLDGLNLQAVPQALLLMSDLNELHLTSNKLIDVAKLSKLTNLTRLNLDDNLIEDLVFLRKLNKLKELSILENRYETIIDLSVLKKLEILSISHEFDLDLEPIKNLLSLKSLDIYGGEIHNEHFLNSLNKLESLRLNTCKIVDIDLSDLKNLQDLDLSENKIIDISFLSNLPNLITLDLQDNNVSDITALKNLKKLEFLYLSNNLITNLKPLKDLKTLKDLSIDSNRISNISALCELTNLEELWLGKNQIEDISPLSKLVNLTKLVCWENNIIDVSILSNLSRLLEINLSKNNIADISSLADLRHLINLQLSFNQIVNISPLKKLNLLSTLNIRGNKISNIDSLKQLEMLSNLDVALNEIAYYPKWIFNSSMNNGYSKEHISYHNGNVFNIYSNPIIDVPFELLVQSKETIEDYFKSLEDGAEPINEIKVILLGEGAAGKTSLMNYLQGKPYQKGLLQTHGINLEECAVQTGAIMKIWDFGGQDIMHHTHQFFLTQKSVYVLVLNARENTDTEKWLKIIQVFGGDSPIIMVTNKIDENPSDHENIKYLNTKYPNLKNRYVRISCEKGTGLDEFKNLLNKTISELFHVKTLWGNSWLQVKRELEEMRSGDSLKDYIHFEKYEEICNKHNVSIRHRETLINWLHQLGIITYFPDSNLNETNVINPSWLTEAFYSIINAESVAKNYGRFNISELSFILNPKRYPKQKYQFLIGLMMKFELCYQIDESTFLIPDLLNKEEPNFDFEISTSVKFKYKYTNLLPKAILPKFMVRRHQEIVDDNKWRTGLLIKDQYFESQALVRVDEEDKEIYIYVDGLQSRGYLASIISNIESINNLYEGLEYEKLVPCLCKACDNSEKPYYYKYDVLKNLREKRKITHICENSFEDVNIDKLLGILITHEELQDEIMLLVGKGTFLTKKALLDGNVDDFINTIILLFSSVSYLLFEKSEKAYHTPLFILLRAIFSGSVRSDDIQAKGRADIIINLEKFIYILELKLDGSASEAMSQIHQKKYYQPYILENKKIILIGINFSSEERNIEDFAVEYIKNS